MSKITTRKDAKEQGSRYYFTGKECKYGHISKRKTCNGECFECTRVYREKNKKAIAKRGKKFRSENGGKIAEQKKVWCVKNNDRLVEKRKKHYLENKEEHQSKGKIWRETNKEIISEKNKKKYADNIETIRAERKKYYNEHRDSINARNRVYRKKHPAKKAARSSLERAVKEQRTPNWYDDECHNLTVAIYEDRNSIREKTSEDHHVDHECPLFGKNFDGVYGDDSFEGKYDEDGIKITRKMASRTVSGLHVPDNMIIMLGKENMSKNCKWNPNKVTVKMIKHKDGTYRQEFIFNK